MVYFRILVSLSILTLLVLGISSCDFPAISDFLPVDNSTEVVPANSPTPTPVQTPTPDITLVDPQELILWLPPQFDPQGDTGVSSLLSSRLDEFVARRPQTNLQIRVKSLTGDYGLLESLQLIDSAAPLLSPNLVALPRPLLEEAFRAGQVIAIDEYRDLRAEQDWYPYALDLAQIDGQTAGIPFGGDLLVMAYKETPENPPPTNWDSLLAVQRVVAYPASDPQGLVTLAWYQSLGGELSDENGNPTLDKDLMLQVLNFYDLAQNANLMPYWLTQFETIDQAWASYLERQSTLAITWTSSIIESDSPNTILAAMPTKDDKAFSYADGWVWCVVPSDSETEQFALELADFLTESDFLSSWASEGGFLPVRPTSLETWSETAYFSTLEKLLPAAIVMPGEDLAAALGPPVRDAVVEVLKDQVDPETALESLLAEIEK
jgi:ABC-type glycerol-3-phosphate transport system substrate-binding protein